MIRVAPTALFGIFAAASLAGSSAAAANDSQAFIEGLRERRYFDTATDYLNQLAEAPDNFEGLKRTLPYEQALVLLDWAASNHDPPAREPQLEQAQGKLKEFLAGAGDDPLAHQARQRLGDLLLYKAGSLSAQAEHAGANAESLRMQAAAHYEQARSVFQQAAKSLRAQLDRTAKDQPDLREQLGSQWLGARLNAARAAFELAQTLQAADSRRSKLLDEAAAECADLYGSYPQRIAGVVARLYEGRCYQALGDPQRAISTYSGLLAALPEFDPQFRALKTEVLNHALECWLQEGEYTTAVDKALAWAKSARGAESQDAQWLAVKLKTATALKELAAGLPKNDPKTAGYLRDAHELAAEATRSDDVELRDQGRMLLAQAGRNTKSTTSAPDSPKPPAQQPKTFDDAFDRASEAIDELKSAQLEIGFVRRETPVDTKKIAELESVVERRGDEAFALLLRATPLAGPKTDPEKLRLARYLLCYFHYQKRNYYDAAVLGEYLARQHTKSETARPASRVALAAFDALYREGRDRDDSNLQFEEGRLLDLAGYISKQWADQPEADAALDILLGFYINRGDYKQAQELLARVSKGSTLRADVEARLGHALWAKYLHASAQLREQTAPQTGAGEQTSQPKSIAVVQSTEDLGALARQAQTALESALDAMRKQPAANERTVLAGLSLAQLYLNQSQPDKAVVLLEDVKVGPLTLLRQDNPATQKEGIPAEINKTALRAYLAAEPADIDKATSALDCLEQIYAAQPDGANRFTQMLVSVAYDLQQQLAELARRGDTQAQAKIMQAFDRFLGRIAQRPSGTDFNTLYWVAATYDSLADGVKQDPASADVATDYRRQAIRAYEAIMARAAQDAAFLPADKALAVKLRLALADRGVGEYDKAIALLTELLQEKQQLLSVQVEAARTYQQRAASEDPKYYEQAILGGSQGPETAIWGWGKLAIQTARDPRFRDTFHEARYNLALCRRQLAESATDADKKTKLLAAAKNDIRITKAFDATLGGDKWKSKYDNLLRELQQATGEPAAGLEGLSPNSQ